MTIQEPNKQGRSKKGDENTKPYQLRFESREGYLYAGVMCGKLTAADKAAYLKEIANKCAEVDCNGVLIDRSVAESVPEGSLYPVAIETQKAFGEKRLAFVNSELGVFGSLEFFKQAYKSLGGHCDVFDTVADAEN